MMFDFRKNGFDPVYVVRRWRSTLDHYETYLDLKIYVGAFEIEDSLFQRNYFIILFF